MSDFDFEIKLIAVEISFYRYNYKSECFLKKLTKKEVELQRNIRLER